MTSKNLNYVFTLYIDIEPTAHLLAIDHGKHGVLIEPNSSMKSLYRLITPIISLINVDFEIDCKKWLQEN